MAFDANYTSTLIDYCLQYKSGELHANGKEYGRIARRLTKTFASKTDSYFEKEIFVDECIHSLYQIVLGEVSGWQQVIPVLKSVEARLDKTELSGSAFNRFAQTLRASIVEYIKEIEAERDKHLAENYDNDGRDDRSDDGNSRGYQGRYIGLFGIHEEQYVTASGVQIWRSAN